MNLKEGIRRNFRRRGASYDQHARVQQQMADKLLAHCHEDIGAAGRILEVGCGTGYLTRHLRRLNRRAWLLAVDLDPDLLRRARQRLNHDAGIAWLAMDAEELCRGSFHLIIANSVFQWFLKPRETLRRYLALLAPGGCLAFSAMGPGTFRELGQAWQDAARDLNLSAWPRPAAADFLDWRDWGDLLREVGFREVRMEQAALVASYASVLQLLKTIQQTGALNPAPRVILPKLYQQMLTTYHRNWGNGSIPATYDLIWAVARKERSGGREEMLGNAWKSVTL
jgi:malonyl-CoA O-methyltransferase